MNESPPGSNMQQRLAELYPSPDLLPQKLDLVTRRVLFLELDETRYRESSFLDDRVIDDRTRGFWSGLDALTTPTAPRPAAWLFHIGHCGSTLLSRLLPAVCPLLPVREPPPLRTLAEALRLLGQPLSRLDDEQWQGLFRSFAAMYSRTWDPAAMALVKASSDCVNLARPAMDQHPATRGLLVYLSLDTYLATMLVGSEARMDVEGHAVSRLMDLHDFLDDRDSLRLYELTPVQRVVVSWLAGVAGLHGALRNGSDRLRLLDFDAFVVQPHDSLGSLARFLGAEVDDDRLADVLAGPVMQTYAKAPEYRFSPEERAHRLGENRRRSAAAIEEGLRWAGSLVERYDRLQSVIEVFPLVRDVD